MTEFILNEQIYDKVIQTEILTTKSYLWIATADIKDMYVSERKKMVPFLKILADLLRKGVLIRLIHAKEPGPAFRKDFDKYVLSLLNLERLLCPRVHFKSVIIDGRFIYSGSANLTGAGMGVKSKNRRNFESGFISTDRQFVEPVMNQFDSLWMGNHCASCGRRSFCPEPIL